MITLHSAPDGQAASLLVIELRANGIEAEAVPDARVMAYGRLPDAGYVQVKVPQDQLRAARTVLAEFLDRSKAGMSLGATWTCTGCRESNEATFEVCWNCQTVGPGAS